jgi:hypothetical protein
MRKTLIVISVIILSISGCDIVDELEPKRRITYTVSSFGSIDNTPDNQTWVFYTDENGKDQQTEINPKGGYWTYTGYFKKGELAYVGFTSVDRTGSVRLDLLCTNCKNAEFGSGTMSKRTDLTLLSANELSIYLE